MRIETLAINDPRWTDAIGRLDHDVYHRPDYVQLEATRMESAPEALLISDEERVFFVPYLVRSCEPLCYDMRESVFDVVSPYGFPGILMNDSGRDSNFAAEALAALRETFARRSICSAFLRMHPILGNNFASLFAPNVFADSCETVAIDLTLSKDEILKQIRLNHHKTIEKCISLGYTARVVSLTDVLVPFSALYKETMDRVEATDSYYFDAQYFANLAQMPGVYCCIVESGGAIAAACVFFECNGIVNAHLGGTRTAFLSRSPFKMVVWEAMRWAKERGNRWLHLGGGVGGKDDSLLHFKAGFSNTRFQFLTSRLVINESKYDRLVHVKAQATNLSTETVYASSYFPAYRTQISICAPRLILVKYKASSPSR